MGYEFKTRYQVIIFEIERKFSYKSLHGFIVIILCLELHCKLLISDAIFLNWSASQMYRTVLGKSSGSSWFFFNNKWKLLKNKGVDIKRRQ